MLMIKALDSFTVKRC